MESWSTPSQGPGSGPGTSSGGPRLEAPSLAGGGELAGSGELVGATQAAPTLEHASAVEAGRGGGNDLAAAAEAAVEASAGETGELMDFAGLARELEQLASEPAAGSLDGAATTAAHDAPAEASATPPEVSAEDAATVARMKEVAETGDVGSPRDGACFYTGGEVEPGADGAPKSEASKLAREAAEAFVAERHAAGEPATTIEMTPAGQEMESLQGSLGGRVDHAQTHEPWTTISSRYAAAAEGEVNVFTCQVADKNRGLQQEVLNLWDNSQVTEIRFHEVVMDGAAPLRDASGRLVTRELMVKDW